MKKNIRKVTAVLLGLLGTILAIYVGGYWLFIRPVRFLYVGFMAGTLTKKSLLIALSRYFLHLRQAEVSGVSLDIIAGHFRDE